MHTPRVLTAEALHETPDRHVGHLQGEMDCINFPTERVHTRSTPGEHRRQQPLEYGVVGGISENGLAGVATLHDVVNASGHMKSGSA
jgi:hypothetical protein